jgi:hypothetical protein
MLAFIIRWVKKLYRTQTEDTGVSRYKIDE